VTEEERRYYNRNIKRIAGSFPDMQIAMADKIVRWNYQQELNNGLDSIHDSVISAVDERAEDYRFNTEDLYSGDVSVQYKKLSEILDESLVKRVAKDDELTDFFAKYVAKIVEKNHRH